MGKKYEWIKSLRALFPSHDVFLMEESQGIITYRFIEPEPVDLRPRLYVDMTFSAELLDEVSGENRNAQEFVISQVEMAKKMPFPAPQNDHR